MHSEESRDASASNGTPVHSANPLGWSKWRVVLALTYVPLIGCNSILGAGDYHVGSKNTDSNAMDGSSPSSEGGTVDHGGTGAAGAAAVGKGGSAGAGAGGSGAGGKPSAAGSHAGGSGNDGAGGGTASGGTAGSGTAGSTGTGGTGSSQFGSCKNAACCSTLTQPTCCPASAVKAACTAFYQGAGGWNGSTGCAADGYMGSFTWFCAQGAAGLTQVGGSSGGAAGAAGAGSIATCATLTACCAKIANPNDKAACQEGETAAGGDESLCDTVYQSIKQLCP